MKELVCATENFDPSSGFDRCAMCGIHVTDEVKRMPVDKMTDDPAFQHLAGGAILEFGNSGIKIPICDTCVEHLKGFFEHGILPED